MSLTTHQSPSIDYPALHNLVQPLLWNSFSTTFSPIHSAQRALVYSWSSSSRRNLGPQTCFALLRMLLPSQPDHFSLKYLSVLDILSLLLLARLQTTRGQGLLLVHCWIQHLKQGRAQGHTAFLKQTTKNITSRSGRSKQAGFYNVTNSICKHNKNRPKLTCFFPTQQVRTMRHLFVTQ